MAGARLHRGHRVSMGEFAVPRALFSLAGLIAAGVSVGFPLLHTAQPAVYAQDQILDRDWSLQVPLASRSLLLDAALVSDGIAVVGERGHVLVSHDDGETWAQSRTPTRSMLCGVASQGNQCWAVGHDAVILHSDDAGRSWTQQYGAPENEEPLFDVWFRDRDYGLAVGAYGLVMETRNGGDSWERRIFAESDAHFYDLDAAGNQHLYVAGEFGTILRSRDEGATWEECPSPYGGSFFGVLPLSDGSVLVFGLRGNVFRSADQGETWQKIETGSSAALLDGIQREDGSVVIVGLSGCVLLSEDAGRSFALHAREDRAGLSKVFEGGGELLFLGERGIERGSLDVAQ